MAEMKTPVSKILRHGKLLGKKVKEVSLSWLVHELLFPQSYKTICFMHSFKMLEENVLTLMALSCF